MRCDRPGMALDCPERHDHPRSHVIGYGGSVAALLPHGAFWHEPTLTVVRLA